jgi:predicted nuclease with TOPRIM domain
MADTSDAAMRERLERVETKIDRLETRFDQLETRFDGLETRFDGLEAKVDDLAMYVLATETRLSEKIDAHASRFDVQIEHIRDDIRRFTESVGSVIERLDRQHAESQLQTTIRLADHDLILQNDGRRISTLELPPT